MIVQDYSPTQPDWQDALDPQLLRRLLSRALQPGVSSTRFAAVIIARMRNMAAPLPLLAELMQRYGEDTIQSEQPPIVHAQLSHDFSERVAAQSPVFVQAKAASSNAVPTAVAPSSVVSPRPVRGVEQFVGQAASDSPRAGQQTEARSPTAAPVPVVQVQRLSERTLNVRHPPIVYAQFPHDLSEGGVAQSPVFVQAKAASSNAVPPSVAPSSVVSPRLVRGVEQLVGQSASDSTPAGQPTGARSATVAPVPVVQVQRLSERTLNVRQPPAQGSLTAAPGHPASPEPIASVPLSRPVVRPVGHGATDVAPLGLAQLLWQSGLAVARDPLGARMSARSYTPELRPQAPSRPVVSETRRSSLQQTPVSLAIVAPRWQPHGDRLLMANQWDGRAGAMEKPPRIQTRETTVEQRHISSLPSTPPESVTSPPVTSVRPGVATGLDLNAVVEKVQSEIDIGKLAERVQRQLRRCFIVERERRGGW